MQKPRYEVRSTVYSPKPSHVFSPNPFWAGSQCFIKTARRNQSCPRAATLASALAGMCLRSLPLSRGVGTDAEVARTSASREGLLVTCDAYDPFYGTLQEH